MENMIENPIMVSFVIPVYNAQNYLRECLESILKINSHNYEIILIDDGSSDDSRIICEEYSKKKCVHLFVQQNKGVSAARNVGIREAKGKYVTFVDSDDKICLLDFSFLETGLDLYCLGMSRFKDDFVTRISFKEEKNIYKQFVKYPAYMNSMCNKFFKRQKLIEWNIRMDEAQKYREDMLFVVSFIINEPKVEYIDCKYYLYRMNPNSASKKIVSLEIINNNIESCNKILLLLDGRSKVLKEYLTIAPVMPFITDVTCYDYKLFKKRVKRPLIWKYSRNRYHQFMSLLAAANLEFLCDLVINIKRRLAAK